jgi:hypothetical protein
MTSSIEHHSVLRRYLGEVVIVLPDLEDPTESEDTVFSDADVRYMGILADCDTRVLKLHPYFLIPRKTDTEREREIARQLAPDLVQEEQGLRARITRGGATVPGTTRARAGRPMLQPKIVPIEQCDSIILYREEDPDAELAELLEGLPRSAAPITPPTPGAVPPELRRLVVSEHALPGFLRRVAEQHGSEGVQVIHVPSSGSGTPAQPAQLLLAHLAELARTAAASPEATELEIQALALVQVCASLDAPPGALADERDLSLVRRHQAALELQRGFPALVESFLAWQARTRALLVGFPVLSPEQERFLVRHGCTHPHLIYVHSRS